VATLGELLIPFRECGRLHSAVAVEGGEVEEREVAVAEVDMAAPTALVVTSSHRTTSSNRHIEDPINTYRMHS
jgi:hypothetical protein